MTATDAAASTRQAGRPTLTKETRRRHQLAVRLRTSELEELKRRAEERSVSLAELLRSSALGKKLPSNRIPAVNLACVGELNHLGRNLNQALVLLHTGRAAPELEATLDELLALFRQLSELFIGAYERSGDD
jgi:hypothetical protein